jgi:hypothetical protein
MRRKRRIEKHRATTLVPSYLRRKLNDGAADLTAATTGSSLRRRPTAAAASAPLLQCPSLPERRRKGPALSHSLFRRLPMKSTKKKHREMRAEQMTNSPVGLNVVLTAVIPEQANVLGNGVSRRSTVTK